MAETTSDVTKLLVQIEANIKQYENAMKKVLSSTDSAVGGASKRFSKLEQTMKQIEDGSGRVGASIRKMEEELAAAAGAAVAPMQLTTQQLQGMQFQLQDLGVQLASGQSPFMAIIQQGSQISQMFGPGSTVMGALRATGAGIMAFISNPINLAVIGFAAAAAAAPKIWEAITGPAAKSATDLLKSVDDLLAQLENGYEGAADAARKFIDAATSGDQLEAMLQRSESQLRAGLAQAIEDIVPRTIAMTKAFGDFSPEVKRGQQEIEELGRRLAAGEITARQFADEIADIRLAENTPDEVKRLADNLLEASQEAQKLERNIDGITAAIDRMSKQPVAFDPARLDQDAQTRQEVMGDLASRLRSQSSSITGPKVRAPRERKVKDPWADFGMSDALLDTTSDLNDMMKELERQTNANRQAFQSLGMGIVNDMQRGASATQVLANSLSRVGSRLLEMGLNTLASSIFPSAVRPDPWAGLRFRAVGGPVAAGSPYMVGENGPELFVPNVNGQVMANQKGGAAMGGGTVFNIDARGAVEGTAEQIKRALMDYDRASYQRHVANHNLAVRDRRVR